jgi:sulfide:quinone oxidoreductase
MAMRVGQTFCVLNGPSRHSFLPFAYLILLMVKITYITPGFAVAPALDPADFARIAELGFRTVVNNRPDGEERGQAQSGELRAHAEGLGLAYRHVPVRPSEVFTDPAVEAMAETLRTESGPILAHCKSGLRSAIVWAAANARTRPVDEIMDALGKAGLNLASIRDDLDSQADRTRWNDPSALAPDVSAAPAEPQGRAAA